jgi:hypothetical protein
MYALYFHISVQRMTQSKLGPCAVDWPQYTSIVLDIVLSALTLIHSLTHHWSTCSGWPHKMADKSVFESPSRKRVIFSIFPNFSVVTCTTLLTSFSRIWHSKQGSSVDTVASFPLGMSATRKFEKDPTASRIAPGPTTTNRTGPILLHSVK